MILRIRVQYFLPFPQAESKRWEKWLSLVHNRQMFTRAVGTALTNQIIVTLCLDHDSWTHLAKARGPKQSWAQLSGKGLQTRSSLATFMDTHPSCLSTARTPWCRPFLRLPVLHLENYNALKNPVETKFELLTHQGPMPRPVLQYPYMKTNIQLSLG